MTKRNGMLCTIIVARYQPRGNIIKQFDKNVDEGDFDAMCCGKMSKGFFAAFRNDVDVGQPARNDAFRDSGKTKENVSENENIAVSNENDAQHNLDNEKKKTELKEMKKRPGIDTHKTLEYDGDHTSQIFSEENKNDNKFIGDLNSTNNGSVSDVEKVNNKSENDRQSGEKSRYKTDGFEEVDDQVVSVAGQNELSINEHAGNLTHTGTESATGENEFQGIQAEKNINLAKSSDHNQQQKGKTDGTTDIHEQEKEIVKTNMNIWSQEAKLMAENSRKESEKEHLLLSSNSKNEREFPYDQTSKKYIGGDSHSSMAETSRQSNSQSSRNDEEQVPTKEAREKELSDSNKLINIPTGDVVQHIWEEPSMKEPVGGSTILDRSKLMDLNHYGTVEKPNGDEKIDKRLINILTDHGVYKINTDVSRVLQLQKAGKQENVENDEVTNHVSTMVGQHVENLNHGQQGKDGLSNGKQIQSADNIDGSQSEIYLNQPNKVIADDPNHGTGVAPSPNGESGSAPQPEEDQERTSNKFHEHGASQYGNSFEPVKELAENKPKPFVHRPEPEEDQSSEEPLKTVYEPVFSENKPEKPLSEALPEPGDQSQKPRPSQFRPNMEWPDLQRKPTEPIFQPFISEKQPQISVQSMQVQNIKNQGKPAGLITGSPTDLKPFLQDDVLVQKPFENKSVQNDENLTGQVTATPIQSKPLLKQSENEDVVAQMSPFEKKPKTDNKLEREDDTPRKVSNQLPVKVIQSQERPAQIVGKPYKPNQFNDNEKEPKGQTQIGNPQYKPTADSMDYKPISGSRPTDKPSYLQQGRPISSSTEINAQFVQSMGPWSSFSFASFGSPVILHLGATGFFEGMHI